MFDIILYFCPSVEAIDLLLLKNNNTAIYGLKHFIPKTEWPVIYCALAKTTDTFLMLKKMPLR